MKSPTEQLLDSERNPWRYVWRCAVSGHAFEDGTCRRCGLPHNERALPRADDEADPQPSAATGPPASTDRGAGTPTPEAGT